LNKVKFDHSKDRLISVGDLVDRGSQCVEMLSFLNEHYGKSFFVAVGNHDKMFLGVMARFLNVDLDDVYANYVDPHLHASRNGGGWLRREIQSKNPNTLDILTKSYDIIKSLPTAIVVGKDTPNRFNVIHTEFIRKHPKPRMVRGWFNIDEPDKTQPYHGKVTDDLIDNWVFDDPFIVENRNILNAHLNYRQQHKSKMSITYSGHSAIILGQPMRFQQQILMDTGAVFYKFGDDPEFCALSMIDHKTKIVHQLNGNLRYRTTTVDEQYYKDYLQKPREKAANLSPCW
jgi:hypothetical protein